jgi:hydrophobe/amphiphile efflux-1 (HAE1) family protein
VFSISGFDLIGGGNKTNAGTMFITLKPWSERPVTSYDVIAYGAKSTAPMRDGMALMFNPPPIRGLGTAAGFEAYLQNRADGDPRKLAAVLGEFSAELRKRPELTGINSFFRPASPQLFVEVDREKALALGVPVNEIFDALQGTMGALYVNDFNKFGRTYRVQLQAEAPYRLRAEDLGSVYVRSATTSEMLPLKSMINVKNVVGAEQLDRFNGFVAAKFLGNGAPGISSGQAIAAVEEVAAKVLPPGYALEWAGQAFQEKRVGRASTFAFAFALVMVFLILAAQYERWSLPFAVLLSVPFAVLGALVAVMLRGMSNDIYFQIGLVTLIGLAAKNAILIVEFAAQKEAEGMSPLDAAVEAARLRFRPIVMTSLAFVLGVVPLVVATGAGAAARKSMGTGVFGGMLAATFIATLFIPLFFVLLSRRKAKP